MANKGEVRRKIVSREYIKNHYTGDRYYNYKLECGHTAKKAAGYKNRNVGKDQYMVIGKTQETAVCRVCTFMAEQDSKKDI